MLCDWLMMYIKARSSSSPAGEVAAAALLALHRSLSAHRAFKLLVAVLAPPFPFPFSLQLFDVEELYLFLKVSGSILLSDSVHTVAIQALRGMAPTEVSMIWVDSWLLTILLWSKLVVACREPPVISNLMSPSLSFCDFINPFLAPLGPA